MDAWTPGTLWQRLHAATEHGLAVGALQPIPTTFETVEDGGIAFQVRVVDNLKRKAEARQRQDRGEAPANPFLPHDPDLFVADVSDTHLAVLNKFNVLDHHLLVITRSFEDQRQLLTAADLGALWACMAEVDGLGFYNGGVEAGASQAHKHLQLAPFPLGGGIQRPPIEVALEDPDEARDPQRSARLPFVHATLSLRDLPADATLATPGLLERYLRLLDAIGLEPRPDGRQSGPYNLLLTRRWMLAVPRSREHYERMSVNAIGFAGGLLVRDAAGLARVREVGPMAILRSVARPVRARGHTHRTGPGSVPAR